MPASSDTTVDHQTVSHDQMANAIRFLSMDAVQHANAGHPGMPMGMADVATVLYSKFLKFDPSWPSWPDRDRFVLSAGHGSMLLYAVNYMTGYEKVTMAEIERFRQVGSLTAGHPEVDVEAGIETTTGPLGQGLGNAVGMALAERILNAEFGSDLVDHHTYAICGDGCMMEGISHEACSLAGHLKLSRLIVLYDDNHISIDGPTSLSFTDETAERFRGYGWDVQKIDGHDPDAIEKAIAHAQTTDTPSLICCRTTIGFGAPHKAGTASAHGSPLGPDEIAGAREALNWPYEPFVVPDDITASWRAVGKRSRAVSATWRGRHANASNRAGFDQAVSGDISASVSSATQAAKQAFLDEPTKIASRAASGKTLEHLVPAIPSLIGGSADLTPSNNTKVKNFDEINTDSYGGRYIHYGVREHGMAATMNGLALHGGIVPYGGTFLTFTDYCRPSIRLSALMHQRVVYVMTHDSIGLGEDGPTHQPIEHLSSLRAMPNLHVLRPADAVETAECWELALNNTHTPSILALTRQGLPPLRDGSVDGNPCARGAYVLREAEGDAAVTLLATGSEVSLAVEARDLLQAEGIGTRVVSMPCWELFEEQDKAYQESVLAPGTAKVAVEAGVQLGWDRYIGPEGRFIGMTGFGASGKGPDLYAHFGITAEAVASAARELV
ncbi:MAG: transketolase [Pseudomonadota bacterium]